MKVLAVQVRPGDPPQFVAEYWEDLHEGAGWSGEQCDSCGGSGYTLRRRQRERWEVECTGTDFGDGNGLMAGCGACYPVSVRDESEVAF